MAGNLRHAALHNISYLNQQGICYLVGMVEDITALAVVESPLLNYCILKGRMTLEKLERYFERNLFIARIPRKM